MPNLAGPKHRTRVTTSVEVKHYCPICGILMDPNGSIHNPVAETHDHVYPKSMYPGPGHYQIVCRRCNSLKGSLPPSELIYQSVRFMRAVEQNVPEVKAQSIVPYIMTKRQIRLCLDFKYGLELDIEVPGPIILWRCKSLKSMEVVTRNDKLFRSLICECFYGPLAKGARVKVGLMQY